MTNLHQKFSSIMSQFLQKIIAIDRAEKVCYGVTFSQAHTIGAIHKNDVLTMNELSQELGLAISTLTRIIDVLVRDGIVSRNHNEQDRRKVDICLTDKGKELAEKLHACSEHFWSNIFESIPDEKKEEVTQNLHMLFKVLGGAEETWYQKN